MYFILPFIQTMWNGGIGTYKDYKHAVNTENTMVVFDSLFSCDMARVHLV